MQITILYFRVKYAHKAYIDTAIGYAIIWLDHDPISKDVNYIQESWSGIEAAKLKKKILQLLSSVRRPSVPALFV